MTKPTLQEIAQQTECLQKRIICYMEQTDGESDSDETLAKYCEMWETVSAALESKINAYCHIIKKLENDEQYFLEMSRTYFKKARKINKNVNVLKDRLQQIVASNGGNLTTGEFACRVQKNASSLIIDDSYDAPIPVEYWKSLKHSDVIDKAKVKNAIKSGEHIEFARLEQSESLRISQ